MGRHIQQLVTDARKNNSCIASMAGVKGFNYWNYSATEHNGSVTVQSCCNLHSLSTPKSLATREIA